jgi:threonine/homoserine/homoserine lactone efflux protein
MPVLVGFFVGFFMAIPPSGPVAISVIQTTLKKGARYGFSVGAGSAVMDAVYILIGLLVSGATIESFVNDYSYTIKIIGAVVLIALGIKEINTSHIDLNSKVTTKKPRKRKYFLLGLMYMITNPLVIITYVTVAVLIQGYGLFEHDLQNNVIMAISLALGTCGWFLTLTTILRKYKKRMSESIIVKINKISGYLFISFGLYFGYTLFL